MKSIARAKTTIDIPLIGAKQSAICLLLLTKCEKKAQANTEIIRVLLGLSGYLSRFKTTSYIY